MLTGRQERFVFEYCKDFHATKAYERAGYASPSAASGGSALLKNPEILEAIEEQKEALAQVACLTPEWVLRQWMLIASADPSELVKVKTQPCGYCWPDLETKPADLPPNPTCNGCAGEGRKYVSVTPTKDLSPAARRLYAGAKQGKEGIEVKMHDQVSAIRSIADYLGMVNKGATQLSGPGGGPVPVLAANVRDMTTEQLEAILATHLASSGVPLGVVEQTLSLTDGTTEG